MLFDDEKKIKRLKEREAKLVSKGYKAVDEGREKKADRILGRAARVENRIITLEEKGKMAMKNDAIDKLAPKN
jgi:phage shock protein A